MTQRRVPAEIAVWAALIAVLLLFGAVTFTTYRSTAGLRPVLADVGRTRAVGTASARLLWTFHESQSERRAYLLTGDEYFLQRYFAFSDSTQGHLATLDSLTRRDADQAARIRRIAQQLARADSIGRVSIELRQRRGLPAAAALVQSRVGQSAISDGGRAVQAVATVEQQRVSRVLEAVRARANDAMRIAIGSAILAVLLLPAASWLIWKDLRGRREDNRALQHATTVAQEATKAKSEFLASMSHEIRTPLNGVIGMTELALDTDLTPTQRDYLLTARSSAESLLRLLNDILDFSKIEAGRLDLETTPFSLRDLLGETLRTLALRAEQKHLELAYRVVPAVPDMLLGDPGRFQQVVVNLVGNAIKFTERGEIVVLVDALPQREGETELQVSVRDTGIGIPPEQLRAVFEPFSQGDSSTTRRFGGTGLGLTISEQLVRLMGGRLWAESEVGRGSTFHFTGRFGVGDQRGIDRAGLDDLEGLRVLIVDDHPTNRLILEEMLAQWRMRPTAVPTGAEALRVAGESARAGTPFQVGVFDYNLPDMDGYAIAERLASDGVLPGRAVIVLSSDTQPGDAARRVSLGISQSLMKPVKHSELLDAILTTVAGTAAPSPLPGPVERPPWAGARVLVVEDNEVNQRVAVGFLRRRGAQVLTANNGREAVDLLARDPGAFDVVLMDVEMPEMDGVEATRRIREAERQRGGRRVPILAVTAHALADERARCVDAGMDMCLVKPLRAREMDEALRQVLGTAPRAMSPSDNGADHAQATLDMFGGDRELLVAVTREYARQTPTLLTELRAAVSRADAGATARIAHKLRGSSLQVAANRVGERAGALEQSAAQGAMVNAEEMVRGIEEAAREFIQGARSLTGDGAT